MINDFFLITKWWSSLLLIGFIFLPFTNLVFPKFFDRGYLFTKILGIVFVSYAIFALGTLHLLPFTRLSLFILLLLFLAINLVILKINKKIVLDLKNKLPVIILEETLFLISLFTFSFVRGFNPDIHGLEKFMDFGFVNSILKSTYFPPQDIWYTGLSINYYYFGHLVTAVLTRITALPSFITFNLMLATISALSVGASFSLGANLWYTSETNEKNSRKFLPKTFLLNGILTTLLVNFAGNLHILYSFFKPYPENNPLPFWQLTFSFFSFPNNYWYPNATRFIPYTIHEFPLYSWVVSDLHGHVLDIPFVLLTLALLLCLLVTKKIRLLVLLGFLNAVMYMTNAWDGILYLFLTIIILLIITSKKEIKNAQEKFLKFSNDILVFTVGKYRLGIKLTNFMTYALTLCLLFILFSLPFSFFFKPFVSGIGILCAPQFLVNLGKIGPFLFEANHCQKSTWWELFTLYGFFYFFAISFLLHLWFRIKKHLALKQSDFFVLLLIIFATFLILVPEFLYVKDIYPQHYRANTMFKLVFQAFILLSIASAYIISRILRSFHNFKKQILLKSFFLLLTLVLLGTVLMYPYFAFNSFYNGFSRYLGLNGIAYLQSLYPGDYGAIKWLNKNIKNQPVILEAQSDSYTDYARISVNTGLPTILGWTVHEWLWRGTYETVKPRIEVVKNLYEGTDLKQTVSLLKKYHVSYVILGTLERQKYPSLNEEKFKALGKIVYQNSGTVIYKLKKF